jgi:hypothetical protein
MGKLADFWQNSENYEKSHVIFKKNSKIYGLKINFWFYFGKFHFPKAELIFRFSNTGLKLPKLLKFSEFFVFSLSQLLIFQFFQ